MRNFLPPSSGRRAAPVWIGGALTALWLLAAGVFLWLLRDAPATGADRLLLTCAIVFPVALIWAVVLVAQAMLRMRQETAALRRTLERLSASVSGGAAGAAAAADPDIQRQLAEIAALTRQALHRPAKPAAARKAAALRDGGGPAPGDAAAQPALPLSAPDRAERMPVSVAELIRALDFPKTAEDRDGFRILRRAMEERRLAKLLGLAQDLLSALSEDGIYMDDLHPDLPMARVWRRFAQGERGITISALGGIRDRVALTLVKSRMKSDAAFRDKAHNFLREFDVVLRNFEQTADDADLNAMATTRTARAFMLLGRVAGTFD